MLHVTKDGHTAEYDGQTFTGANASFALWLNTAHWGFDGAALVAHLEATGCTVVAAADDPAAVE
jgi:hypothetical protein